MSPIEIIMLILGIVLVIISCLFIDHSQEETIFSSNGMNSQLSEEELLQTRAKVKEILSDLSEETVVRTDDYLSKVSNEKIIAVNDFSEQILEKMKHNHDEVIFLYNMLGDKEKELKAIVRELDSSKAHVNHNQVRSDKAIERRDNTPDNQLDLFTTEELNEMINQIENKNQQILSLHSQGKSVKEISKQLGLGQGEVKLVVDLYQDKQ